MPRDGPGGEISTGAHGERRPVPTSAAARHRHHRGEDQDSGPDRSPHQDRIGMTEGDKAKRQPGEAAERQAQQQPRGYRPPQSGNYDDRQCRRQDDDELNCPRRLDKQQKERRREDGEAKAAHRVEQRGDKGRRRQPGPLDEIHPPDQRRLVRESYGQGRRASPAPYRFEGECARDRLDLIAAEAGHKRMDEGGKKTRSHRSPTPGSTRPAGPKAGP
jgi:hypothetical protein